MKRIISSLLFVVLSLPAFAWGREGHEAIAKIADNHLKKSTKNKIEKYLDGHSIVYYAKWMDDYRHTPEYNFTTKWHVARVDENLKYKPNTKDGDAIIAINQAINVLKNYKSGTDSTVAVNIKYLIHLVGDMHCPSHIYYTGKNQDFIVDFGGGYIKPRQKIRIHTVWDETAIKATRVWGLTDWAWELDKVSPKEVKKIVAGDPQHWLEESAERCIIQFDMAQPEENIAQDFVNEAMPLIETQILYAGLRLSSILNKLF